MLRPRPTPARVLAIAFALAAVAATSAGATGPVEAPPPQVPEVGCETRIQVQPAPEPVPFSRPRYIRAGPVIFSALFRRDPRKELRPPRPGGVKFIKAPVFVEAGLGATVSITGPSRARATLQIGRMRGGHITRDAIKLVPCPPDARVGGRRVGSPTPFIGGWRIKGPGCVRIAVLPEGATDPIRKRLPFGKGTCRR